MNLLLDTHTFLWFFNDDPRLSDRLKDLIENENNVNYLSIASLWEMSIKYNLGKLSLALSYEDFIEKEIITSSIILLNIEEGRRQEAEGRRQNSRMGFRPKSEFKLLNILLSRGLRPLLPPVALMVRATLEGTYT